MGTGVITHQLSACVCMLELMNSLSASVTNSYSLAACFFCNAGKIILVFMVHIVRIYSLFAFPGAILWRQRLNASSSRQPQSSIAATRWRAWTFSSSCLAWRAESWKVGVPFCFGYHSCLEGLRSTKPGQAVLLDAWVAMVWAVGMRGTGGSCRGSIKNKAIFFFNWPPYFFIFSHCLQFQKTQKQEKSRITT